MKTLFIAAALLLTAQAVPALANGHKAEREARFNAWCQANADMCREVLAWRQQCQADPEKCRAEIQARREAMRAQCQADPEKCRAEIEAHVATRFKQADANGDGGLSREEAQKAMPRAARHFDQIDANRDGIVTLEELQAARKARAGHRPMRGAMHLPAGNAQA
jgi:hypothetical protein